MAALLDLPDELVQEIFAYLPASSAASLGLVNRRLAKISNTPLLWRRYVLDTWKHWEGDEWHRARVNGNPLAAPWRSVYGQRWRNDKKVVQIVNRLLSTQQSRIERMESIVSELGHDAEDVLRQLAKTPDDAEDVLARRYYSEALLGLIHRQDAIEIWNDMDYQDFPRLETCLGAFDTFVQGAAGNDCNERHLDVEFDRIAQDIRNNVPGIDELDYTSKATTIASQLRSMNLLGSTEQEYHYLKNNFICHVLKSEHKVSLPLVSTAIFCCVTQRFGLRAWPCNFPFHIHAVLESPAYPPLYETRSTQTFNPGVVWMDPWRHDNIIDQDTMRLQLRQYGITTEDVTYSYLSPAFTRDMVLRTGRNIMRSVNETRDNHADIGAQEIDVDAAFYSFLWSVFLVSLGDSRENALQRRNYIPYLLDQFKSHYPEDVRLVERFVLPMFAGHPAQNQIMDMIEEHRLGDSNPKPINRRDDTQHVKFKVGQPFRHKRFDYVGVIIGWDSSCQAGEPWIMQMRVDTLPKGRSQSFYHILGADKSSRYVAEENIVPLEERPPQSLMKLAGRHFKRYDDGTMMFISNIKDEYPDD